MHTTFPLKDVLSKTNIKIECNLKFRKLHYGIEQTLLKLDLNMQCVCKFSIFLINSSFITVLICMYRCYIIYCVLKAYYYVIKLPVYDTIV